MGLLVYTAVLQSKGLHSVQSLLIHIKKGVCVLQETVISSRRNFFFILLNIFIYCLHVLINLPSHDELPCSVSSGQDVQ